ncbi:phosphoadenosine phosphosulfate reductase domain-containing protein [Actinoplanes sp. URMC 104]|uniref:phosphoadenosine phosphosulfate reductase domain-containing protein n=1 Tax=Actinoplanes sp. URMC 104 TaxID=3423409 RepID=UPI003F1CB965
MTADHRAPRDTDPDLTAFDRIIVNHSGGKDGQTALMTVAERAAAAGVTDRVVVQYNDLGNVVWPSTVDVDAELAAEGFTPWLVDTFGVRPGCKDLARQHAEHFGFRFEVRSRTEQVLEYGERVVRPVDLVDDVIRRGKFPDAARRWCTSDFKRAPGQRLLTEETNRLGLDRPARILYVFGYRAQESKARAGKTPCGVNRTASNLTRRHVTDWYPVHHWTVEQVWDAIHASGLPYAWPYDADMSRLSCSLCVLAGKEDLLRAVRLRPRLAERYAVAEMVTGHQFQQGRSIASLIAEARQL